MVALFAAVPTFIVFSLITWGLLLFVNSGIPLNSSQIFLAFFSGFSFALAAGTCIYACRLQVR